MAALSAAAFLFHACDTPESPGVPWSLPPYIQDKGDSNFTLKIDEGVTIIKAGEYAAVSSIGSGADRKTFNTKITRQTLGLETDAAVRTAVTTIILPSTLETIEDYAFYGHTAVKLVRIPKAVQSIGAHAFGKTGTALTLDFKDDSKLGTIGAGAFDIASIAKIQAPRFTLTKNAGNTTYTLAVAEGVTSVAKGEFSSREITSKSKITLNTRLKGALLGARPNRAITAITLPSTLETIEDYGFYNHGYVQGTLTIPSKVQNIGKYAFQYIGNLEDELPLVIEFAKGSQLTTIEADAFSHNSITGLTLPEQLETIGVEAFAFSNDKDEKMASFTIPANVTKIGFGAFAEMQFSNSATLTILSPHLAAALGDGLFASGPTDTVFTTVKLPQVVYDGYTKAELESRFGQVTAYQDLDGSAHTPKP